MASNGPRVNDSNNQDDSATPHHPNGYRVFLAESGDKSHYVAHDGGRAGITVWPADDPRKRTCIPGVAGRFQKGDGVVYILPTEWQEPYYATAEEVNRGIAFAKIGEHAAADWHKNHPHRLIWQKVASSWPITSPSPRVTEGLPPLAPLFHPSQDDEETAQACWGAMADRLTPTGRWIVGLVLMSPWIDRAGATSSVLSLWGEAGEGKSLLAQVCSALFGVHDESPSRGGLFQTFDSSPQGIKAQAQDLSYYPMILDEVQAATGDVESQLRALVMGADRSRANRSGSAVASAARWGGLVLVTGNEPLDLVHEMFTRRLIEVQVCDLWADVPPAEQWQERAAYWQDIAQKQLPVMEGWPWYVLTKSYLPGSMNAQQIISAVHQVQIPGPGNLGMLGQIASVGAQWLAEWTGSSTWTDGVWQAGANLITERLAAAPNPARDAATQIIDDMATNPGAWNESTEYDAHGVLADDVQGQVCGCNHDGQCVWYNIYAKALRDIVDVPLRRLGRTRFRHALYTTGSRDLTRPVRRGLNGARPRVATVCIEALVEIATPIQPAHEQQEARSIPQMPEPLEIDFFPEGDPDPFQNPHTVGDTPITDEEEFHIEATDDGEEDPNERVFLWTVGTDIDAELDSAIDKDATDLVVPTGWPVKTATRWDLGDWTATGASRRVTRPDGRGLRVWSWSNGNVAPEDYCTALREFHRETGYNFNSPNTLSHSVAVRFGRGYDGNKQRRDAMMQLTGRATMKSGSEKHAHMIDIADTWEDEGLASIRYWGERKPTVPVVSYDRNKAYLPSISNARIAPFFHGEPSYQHYGADAPVDKTKYAGMYKIVVPEWNSPLPPPHGSKQPGDIIWVSTEIMDLYQQIERDYPHMAVDVTIVEAWLGVSHQGKNVPQLEHLTTVVTRLLDKFDNPTRMIPKQMYSGFAGSISSPLFRRAPRRIYRPDWAAAIEQNAWCNVLRNVYTAYEIDNRYIPVNLTVDAVKYPADLPTPPGFKIGTGLGQYKIEG